MRKAQKRVKDWSKLKEVPFDGDIHSDIEKHKVAVVPPSSEDKQERAVAARLRSGRDAFLAFHKNIENAAKRKFGNNVPTNLQTPIGQFAGFFDSYLKKNIYTIRKKELASKSVYQAAKESGIEFKKLLYVLRAINFPLTKNKRGKYSNLIHGDHARLFTRVLPFIKRDLYSQKTRKEWIKAIKEQKKWKKSRISKFMGRRIKDGLVPFAFFDIIPPTQILMAELFAKKKIEAAFKLLALLDNNIHLHNKTIKQQMTEMVKATTKALLSR